MHGFVEEARKQQLLRQAGLHLCASDAEGWGQVVIEAAAFGLPTIARRVPGLRDSIADGRTGWLVEDHPGDPEAIVASLVRAVLSTMAELDDLGRREQVFTACREWAGQYSWEAMRHQAADLMEAELRAVTIR